VQTESARAQALRTETETDAEGDEAPGVQKKEFFQK